MAWVDLEPYRDGVLGSLVAPWRRSSTWWVLGYTLLSGIVGTITFSVLLTLAATSGSLIITFPLAIPLIWLTFVCGRGVGRLERSRAAVLLEEEVADPVRPFQKPRGWWSHWKARFTDAARWKEMAHGVLLFPLGLLAALAVLVAWCGSVALLALPLYVGGLPGGTAHFYLFDVESAATALPLALAGLVGLVLGAPWLTVALGRLQAAEVRWLLGPRRRDDLEERVTTLEHSRTAAVDSAEAERRRIERDLHDGAQQRLVALAVTLGEARQRLDDDPEAGRALVAESHEEAKAALKEIRDLVRGIHPVILEDRGLDAALSAVVARSPVPVTLEVAVPDRLPAAVESAAYFVVTEALTNVARHAQAKRAWVTLARQRDRLLVEVRDDGVGGASPALGSGLAGLRDRVDALGGWMHVVSPPGGPTTLTVELPCGS
jgi:signal transduction histidine kinase